VSHTPHPAKRVRRRWRIVRVPAVYRADPPPLSGQPPATEIHRLVVGRSTGEELGDDGGEDLSRDVVPLIGERRAASVR
jgi:hypothetical protein